MNKRAKNVIFIVFSVIVIVSIAITLIFIPKETKPLNYNSDNNTDNELYAESFSLNMPDTIQILKGTSVGLLPGYFEVLPSQMSDKLTTEIQLKSGGVVNGIQFQNNKISAISAGNYAIKFKMPKTKSTYFSKTVNINVYENQQNSHVYLNNFELKAGDSKNIAELFTIKEGLEYDITVGANLIMNGNNITANYAGECDLNFVVTSNYLKYNYNFTISVLEQPSYVIELVNVSNNTINIDRSENDVEYVQFVVKNREGENVSQLVKAKSSDSSIVEVEQGYDDVLVKLKALKSGTAHITLYLQSDESIETIINVLVN